MCRVTFRMRVGSRQRRKTKVQFAAKVNHCGSSPWWLPHADWDGVHLADFVMPGFLVIMGTSISLSLSSQKDRGAGGRQLLRKALVRAAKLFAMGLFIQVSQCLSIFQTEQSSLEIVNITRLNSSQAVIANMCNSQHVLPTYP